MVWLYSIYSDVFHLHILRDYTYLGYFVARNLDILGSITPKLMNYLEGF